MHPTPPLLVKRYARTRLYDTVHACYVTPDDVRRWVARGMAVSVVDADTGEDVTAMLLA